MVSSTNSTYNLTVANSASPSYTLKVLSVVALVAFPVVLAYQGWSLWVFRKRITGGPGSTSAVPVPPAEVHESLRLWSPPSFRPCGAGGRIVPTRDPTERCDRAPRGEVHRARRR